MVSEFVTKQIYTFKTHILLHSSCLSFQNVIIHLYHSRWLLQSKTGCLNPLLNLVPGRWKWWSVCRDDDGGCWRGI